MLRNLVLALIFLNGIYFAWSQGWFALYGLGPVEQAEPQRLRRQINPEAVRLATAEEVRQIEQTPSPRECLQAGVFTEPQTQTLRRALEAALPPGSWQLEVITEPARWLIYMGRYADDAAVARKRGELAVLSLRDEPLQNPALYPGLSLGTFTTQAQAQEALNDLSRRGIRTARVIQDQPELRGSLLKLAAVDEALRLRLDALKPALAGKPWRPCVALR